MENSELSQLLKTARCIHFIGIGGSGMFPLVEILHREGYAITGSDVNEGSIIDKERHLGINISIGHKAENVTSADAVVVTAALLPENPEVARALELSIPIIERAELLGYITSRYGDAFCISGTHGKTTTSSMLTSIFIKSDIDVSAVIGGSLPLIDGYGRSGKSDVMVCEACEFKSTFLKLSPKYAVILNVDADHLDCFGDLDGVKSAFHRFAGLASEAVIANGDDANTLSALDGISQKVILFGENAGCDYIISDVENHERAFYSFTLSNGKRMIGRFKLRVPGRHNVHNAAAAAACADLFGIKAQSIQAGFASFTGAGRRFEILGEVLGVTFADDYAHHPTELTATLEAALKMGYDRVIAVFQPFTYSRTAALLDDFAKALSLADIVVMTEIMGSREINTLGISTADLAKKISGSVWFQTFDAVCDHCLSIARPGDLIITLGCGDIYKAAKMMVKKCKNYKK